MAEDERLHRDTMGASRRSREIEDRKVTEDRELTDDDRLDMFRNRLFNAALPDLPDLPGYHVCWLTTTNPRDSIQSRMQLGYELIRPEEMPGMLHATLKTGEWVGCIGVNEMLAAKLPMRLYQGFMKEAHYDAPNREAGKLTDTADFLKDQAERDGGRLIEGDGLQDLRRATPAPKVFEG